MSSRRTKALGLALLAGASAPMVALRRWGANPDPTAGAPLDLPPGEEMAVPTSDGGQLAAWVMGPEGGPVIVCVHGWTGERRIWAAPARRLLTAGWRVVVYDQRGHGRSRAGHAGLTISAVGDDVASILEQLDVHDAVVAGHSMGGMAVQAFAIEHKEVVADRVRGLALVSTAGAEMSLKRLDGPAGRLAGSTAATRLMANATMGPLLTRSTFGAHPALVALRATNESFVAAPPATRKAFLEAMTTMNLHPYLGSITAPTIVISGTRDTLVPHARSRRTGELIPGARFIPIEGAGHQLPFETPDRLADLLAELGAPRSKAPGPAASRQAP